MSSSKKGKQPLTSQSGALIRKLRKPMAPPTRVVPDESKYSRARERELVRRTVKSDPIHYMYYLKFCRIRKVTGEGRSRDATSYDADPA